VWRRLLVDSPSVWKERKPVSLLPPAAASSSADQDALPDQPLPEFFDPVTEELMLDPVIAADGQTYERSDLQDWLQRHDTSPITGNKLSSKDLTPNTALKERISEFCTRTGYKPRAAAGAAGGKQKRNEDSPFGCHLIEAIQMAENPRSKNDIVVVMTGDISRTAMERLLEFWYTGLPAFPGGSVDPVVQEVGEAAVVFGSEHLATICKNAEEGKDMLNPSIGTFLNDATGQEAKNLFLNRPLFADLTFNVQGKAVPAHKALICARCPSLVAMVTGATEPVAIEADTTLPGFLLILEYLYTDHAPIDGEANIDRAELLRLCHKYKQPRLKTLAELYTSKAVEVATRVSVSQCELPICPLLEAAQESDAQQLVAFMNHFCCTNFGPVSQRADFAKLSAANKKHITENQWPPLSYLQQVEDYKKAVAKFEKGGDSSCLVM
jgi:hypothetical protein